MGGPHKKVLKRKIFVRQFSAKGQTTISNSAFLNLLIKMKVKI